MSIRTITTVLLVAITLIAATGCASSRAEKKKEKAAVVPGPPTLVGTITLVNLESQFVLIDNGLLPAPQAGLALRSFTNGEESAELVTSAAQRRPFTIADIRQGTPRKGDRVFVASSVVLPAQPVDPSLAPARAPVPPAAPDFLPPVQLSPTP